jgi:hypothetical protein
MISRRRWFRRLTIGNYLGLLVLLVVAVAFARGFFGQGDDFQRFDRQAADVVGRVGRQGTLLALDFDGDRVVAKPAAAVATTGADRVTARWLAEVDHRVRLILPTAPTRDDDDVLLAFIFPESGGETLGERLIRDGVAFAERRFDHPFATTLHAAEADAIRRRAGVWQSLPNDPPMPEWRKRWRSEARP